MPTRAAGPAVAALAPACRTRQFPPRAAAVPRGARASHGSSYRREVPSGLAASSAAAAGTPTRKRLAAVPRIRSRQPARLGLVSGTHMVDTSVALTPGLTECDGIGMRLRARSACPTLKV